MGKPKSLREAAEAGQKAVRKAEHMRTMPYEVTPAQRLMRSEMEAGVHKEAPHSRACGIRQHPHGAQCSSDCPTCHGKANPYKLDSVLKEEVGKATSAEPSITELAYNIINEHGGDLKTGLREWQIIQNMVEAGIRAGRGL